MVDLFDDYLTPNLKLVPGNTRGNELAITTMGYGTITTTAEFTSIPQWWRPSLQLNGSLQLQLTYGLVSKPPHHVVSSRTCKIIPDCRRSVTFYSKINQFIEDKRECSDQKPVNELYFNQRLG